MVVFPVIGLDKMLPLIVPLSIGNERGCAVGVIVVDPTTISGTEAEPSGTAVPVRVAVTVVDEKTSVRVTIPPGRAVELGFVVC